MIQLYDDDRIGQNDKILRRVMEVAYRVQDGIPEFTSQVFILSSSDGGMSVNVEKSIFNAGIDPKDYDKIYPGCKGIVLLPVSGVRKLNFILGFDSKPDNPHHAQV